MNQIQTVLCPVDFTELSEQSLALAIELCQRLGARLVLHHNLETPPPGAMSVSWMWSEEHEPAEVKTEQEIPERFSELFERIPASVDYEAKVSRGPLDDVLLFLARDLPADLIVMGSHGWTDAAHQSVTERVVVRAPCPVITTPTEALEGPVFGGAERGALEVVVPLDFTRRSRSALKYAVGLAEEMSLRLNLVHIYKSDNGDGEPSTARRRLERLRSRLPEAIAGSISVRSAEHALAEGIREAVTETGSSFVIMASHGKGPLDRWLHGTTTMDVLHGCSRPVLFIPSRLRRPKKRLSIDLS